MTSGSIRRNYLYGAGLAAVLSSASISPAFAASFTDSNGNTCDTSVTVAGPGGMGTFCPNSSSSSSSPSFPNLLPAIEKMSQSRARSWADPAYNTTPYGRYLLGNGLMGNDLDNIPSHQVPDPNPPGPPDDSAGPLWSDPVRSHLGMYVSSNGGMSSDVTLGGGGYSLRNSGASISDTAGLIAPGTNSASYRENGGGGGISYMYDASRLVGPNQKLGFFGTFDYTSSSTNFGGVGAGSTINSNNYSFTGTALYSNYNTYLALKGSYQFGNNSEFNSSDNSTGSYGSDGYDIDATVGHIFWLLNTMSQPTTSRMAVKAPPRPSDGYAIGLDLSGHLGYQSDVARGFTDSSGFVFGDERAQGGETGLKATLFATVLNNGVLWQPYVTGTVDWRFNYSHIANFPGQVALASADAVTFDDATTFVGAQVGLDVTMSNGWIVGANGFYDRSSDTEIVGGKAYVKIPFGATAVSARY
jgi:hypothetical protein